MAATDAISSRMANLGFGMIDPWQGIAAMDAAISSPDVQSSADASALGGIAALWCPTIAPVLCTLCSKQAQGEERARQPQQAAVPVAAKAVQPGRSHRC